MKSLYLTLFFFTVIYLELFSQSLGTGETGFSEQTPVKMNKPIGFSEYKEVAFLFVDFNNYAIRQVVKNGFDKLNKPADVIIINRTLWVADLYNHQSKQQKL